MVASSGGDYTSLGSNGQNDANVLKGQPLIDLVKMKNAESLVQICGQLRLSLRQLQEG